MIFKHIYIDLERKEFPVDMCYDFLKKSRHVCNYIEREYLAKIKYKANGFSRLVITLSEKPNDIVWINSSKVLCVQLKYLHEEYNSLKTSKEISEYFISKLKLGIKKILSNEIDLPIKEINEGITTFRNLGYVNEWIHKKKKIRSHGILVALNCKLTQEHFYLDLNVFQNEKNIFHEQLLVLDPDEIAFSYRFKDVFVDNEKLIVSSKVVENLFEIPLEKILSF